LAGGQIIKGDNAFSYFGLQTPPDISHRAAGNGFDLNFARKKWVIVFRNKNRKLVKRARFLAIGFWKLNFGSVIADAGNMTDSYRVGAQHGDGS
jgi:hypothetical protein